MDNNNFDSKEQLEHINVVADALAVLICRTLANEKMVMAHGLTALALATVKVCTTIDNRCGARKSASLGAFTGALNDFVENTE